MNGLSDVRLTLGQQELQQDATPRMSTPADYGPPVSRWTRLLRRISTRRALLTLNDQQLADIGLTRAQANREANLPFWKL
ncbi:MULTISPECIES: DUF1127 domain-containing protein [Pseudomonas]|uniref:Uncharacterized conserved protein YjiS, DUF1127 family n=1 Tax=Pseudomonas segetis TaxID=298908 RepID=A0A239FZK0_9PSED|nr:MULTISPECIES: DUF1127 domain-containing protein [Pseudomonas]SNS61194.1 Uncharacterized conserved protein YjiS, DUF1127 family [Pseudomonas segetis]